MSVTGNILDPIHQTLDSNVWDDSGSDEPRLKATHLHWIKDTIDSAFTDAGYAHVKDWATLYLTGSLTTYQYGPESDVDISVFVNTAKFPEWSRAELIGIATTDLDGQRLPGTTHPLQVYIVPEGIKPDHLYRRGLRSAYDLQTDRWLIPPERDRSHDVSKEMRRGYLEALEDADKMVSLLQYEPFKAGQYYRQLHRRRSRDQAAGKGDYADSNIAYKFVLRKVEQAGMISRLQQATGQHIGRVSMPKDKLVRKFVYDGDTGQLKLWDDYAAEEGEAPSHYQLGTSIGIPNPYAANALVGTISRLGYVQFEGGGGDNETRMRAEQALRQAVPDIQGFIGGDTGQPLWSFDPL